MEAEAINVRFPFSVTNLEFRNKIEEILSLQANPLENRLKGLKPAARTLYDKGIELQNKLQDMVNNSEWEVKSNDLEYTSYTMKDNSHLLYIKSIAIVPATPIEVYTYLQLDQYTKEHDYYYLGGKTIEEYSVNIKTRHWTFSTGMFAARRDFVLLQHTQYNPDGSIHVAFGSIEDPRLPPTMIPVRGNVAVAGYVIRPRSDGKSELVYATAMNMCGSLAGLGKKNVVKEQGKRAYWISRAFAKRFNP
eukprot:TRINITY_DN79_c0_g1_i3.p1 TRINITY_DN79_c0_g1~~TRINITY_DN79_c0_g1_i3.p1  ORF type:complete len:248 (-),score=35.85 TRINITY_DN79_c0_g1_i3:57-800(-)